MWEAMLQGITQITLDYRPTESVYFNKRTLILDKTAIDQQRSVIEIYIAIRMNAVSKKKEGDEKKIPPPLQ